MSSEVKPGPGSVVVVEDDEALAMAMATALRTQGHRVATAGSGEALDAILEDQLPDLILLDLNLPGEGGLEILRRVKGGDEDIATIVVTGDREVATVVQAMKSGADHFMTKPFDLSTLTSEVDRNLAQHRLRRRASVLSQRASVGPAGGVLPDLVGRSAGIQRVRDLVIQVADTDSSVVLLGESGTGKGMVAHAIHQLSRRAAGAFVDINCASIQPSLLESEIFGYEKGAFTGASARKPGLMEVANGGTLFLDEIAEMEPQAQAKLLTAVERHVFRRLGGVREIQVDVRIVAATHHDLEQEARERAFRQDLYYRLNVFQIELPPLRERTEDLADLVCHFVKALNGPLNRRVEAIEPEALELLASYGWPGNVRELRNVVERAMILTSGRELLAQYLPPNVLAPGRKSAAYLPSLATVEEAHVRAVLAAVGFNVQKAAKVLDISRSTLYVKMDQYGIARSPGKAV